MNEIIEKARQYALSEIEKYSSPKIEHFELSNVKGQEIAEKLRVDKDIVMLGIILMDLKLGECVKNNKVSEHIEESSKAALEFLKKSNLSKEIIKKIINCVEAHHATKQFICKEAEICANADCYRFLSLRGFVGGLILFGNRDANINSVLDEVEAKVDEKYKILSLDVCKEELEPQYKIIKKVIEKAKNEA